MPDVPDIREPVPDLGHEMLRQSVVAALDDLEAKTVRMAGSLLLARTALDFAQTFLDAVVPLQQAVTEQAAQIAELQAQVAALTPTAPEVPR